MFLEMFEVLIVISLLAIVIYEIKIIKSHIVPKSKEKKDGN